MMDPAVLQGVRVLDWTSMAAGPGATAVLADFGAMVTKVAAMQTAAFFFRCVRWLQS